MRTKHRRWPKNELMIMNSELANELAPGVRRMLAAAEQRGIAVELRRRPAANSLEEAAELLGIRPSDMAKTIVVRRSRGSYLFALIPGDTQIAWPKLRSLLGVSKMNCLMRLRRSRRPDMSAAPLRR